MSFGTRMSSGTSSSSLSEGGLFLNYQKLTSQARGEQPADLVIKNARIPNLFSYEIEEGDVAVSDGVIVGVGRGYEGLQEFDAHGLYLVPGFIESHCHIESTMLTPEGFAELVLPHGTTTVFADPHEIANTSSMEGVQAMCSASKKTPLDLFFNAPSCVPASPFETPQEPLEAGSVRQMFAQGCYGLGEMMNYPGVVAGDSGVWEKIQAAQGQVLNGHAPQLAGKQLCAYMLSRCNSDHECSRIDEAAEKLRRGCWVMMRQGATEHNLAALAPLIREDERRASRCMLVSDDLTVQVLQSEGHMDRLLRAAVECGISPLSALRMVTLNPAEFNRRYDRGAIAPGYNADMVLLEDLRSFRVAVVWKDGERALVPPEGYGRFRGWPGVSHNHCSLVQADLAVPAGGKLRALGVIPGEVITSHLILDGAVNGGEFIASSELDLAKMAVINRNTPLKRVGLGFVKGMGLKRGALGSSIAHDAHNFSVLGMDDASMLAAFNALKEKGGLVVADGSEIVCHLPLPIAGLMSPLPARELFAEFEKVLAASRRLGVQLPNPFMVMSFLSLSVIPELKLTDQGYVDLSQGGLLPLNVQ